MDVMAAAATVFSMSMIDAPLTNNDEQGKPYAIDTFSKSAPTFSVVATLNLATEELASFADGPMALMSETLMMCTCTGTI